jgi:site-specific recombinase XerD
VPDGRGLDRHGAARIVRQAARRAGITKPVGPHTLRHAAGGSFTMHYTTVAATAARIASP